MNDHDIPSERVSTPLCDATHKTRVKLLVASSAGIVIYHTGLIPEKIEGLGITFGSGQQRAMVYCLLGLIGFLCISFFIYAFSDIVSIRLKRKRKLETALLTIVNEAVEKGKEGNQQANAWYSAKQAISNISKPLNFSPRTITLLSRVRFAWDVVLPMVVALYAIATLIIYLDRGVAQ